MAALEQLNRGKGAHLLISNKHPSWGKYFTGALVILLATYLSLLTKD
ncbi:MAG: hypothetical protein M0Z31_06520 [Clostridia bacterium]|nr:hypothetical protein [Clostridia bacterium]